MKGETIARVRKKDMGTITYHGGPLRKGTRFTIAGYGVGSRGQMVIDGINPATKRKCKSVKPMLFEAGESVTGTTVKIKQVRRD